MDKLKLKELIKKSNIYKYYNTFFKITFTVTVITFVILIYQLMVKNRDFNILSKSNLSLLILIIIFSVLTLISYLKVRGMTNNLDKYEIGNYLIKEVSLFKTMNFHNKLITLKNTHTNLEYQTKENPNTKIFDQLIEQKLVTCALNKDNNQIIILEIIK